MNNNENFMQLVSVILPAYNAELFLNKAIDSVLAQTYTSIELIIIDDASTDNTKTIISSYTVIDNRVKPIFLNDNVGVAEARNKGIKRARGDFIAFIDADDFWYPEKIALQLSLLSKENLDCCHTYYYRVVEGGIKKLVKSPFIVSYQDMLSVNHIGNSTAIYRAGSVGKFYQESIGHEDYKMWLSLLRHTDSVCVTEPLVEYQVHSGSLSSNLIRGLAWHWNIIFNEPGLNIFKKIFYMIKYVVLASFKRI